MCVAAAAWDPTPASTDDLGWADVTCNRTHLPCECVLRVSLPAASRPRACHGLRIRGDPRGLVGLGSSSPILSAVRDISAFFAAVLVLAGAGIQAGLAAGESVRAEKALRGSASATRREVSAFRRRDNWVALGWGTISMGAVLGAVATWPF